MKRGEFSGVCLFIVSDQKDIEQVRPLRERLTRVPVFMAGVAVSPPSSLLRSTGTVFHRFFAVPSATEGTPSAEAAGEPEAMNTLLKKDHGPILAVFMFDDREPVAAHWALTFKRLRIPVYLLQRETALPGDAFGIAGAMATASGARWGHTRPTRIVVQSPELALNLGMAASRLKRDDFGVNGLDEILFGQVAFSGPWNPPLATSASTGLVLVEEQVLTPAQDARLAELAEARDATVLSFDPAAAELEMPGAARRLLLTRSTAIGMEAVRQGWLVIVIDPTGLAFEDEGAPIIVCTTAERSLRLLNRVWNRPPQPDWLPPGRLLAKTTAVAQTDIVAQEITDRFLRAAARAKAPVVIPGATPVRGLRRFEAVTHLRFPLFPFEELRAGIDRVEVPRVVVITHDWSDRTGLARPAKYYLTALNSLGIEGIALEVSEAARAADILGELRIDDFVIFNSIGIFERSDAAVEVLAQLEPRNHCLYLHETAFTMRRFAEQQPARCNRLLPWLRDVSVFCVSRKQADFFRATYGVRQTHVVYNTTSLPPTGGAATGEAPGRPVIAMVGTVQRRKGADLFSEVADLAARDGHDWAFEWIGHETEEAASLYLSGNVAWRGRLEGPALTEAMQQVDTLFLSSMDDPFPLSVLEAIRLGKRVVCFAETGIEEVIRGLPGAAVFDAYTAEAALAALVAARRETVSPAANAALEEQVFGLCTFLNRMTAAIEATQDRWAAPVATAARALVAAGGRDA